MRHLAAVSLEMMHHFSLSDGKVMRQLRQSLAAGQRVLFYEVHLTRSLFAIAVACECDAQRIVSYCTRSVPFKWVQVTADLTCWSHSIHTFAIHIFAIHIYIIAIHKFAIHICAWFAVNNVGASVLRNMHCSMHLSSEALKLSRKDALIRGRLSRVIGNTKHALKMWSCEALQEARRADLGGIRLLIMLLLAVGATGAVVLQGLQGPFADAVDSSWEEIKARSWWGGKRAKKCGQDHMCTAAMTMCAAASLNLEAFYCRLVLSVQMLSHGSAQGVWHAMTAHD
jgi:hypothetical protein